jgi:hypothetical protein
MECFGTLKAQPTLESACSVEHGYLPYHHPCAPGARRNGAGGAACPPGCPAVRRAERGALILKRSTRQCREVRA